MFSPADAVTLLYQNGLGYTPSPAGLAQRVAAANARVISVATIGLWVADSTENADHIHLIGLQQTGMEYSV